MVLRLRARLGSKVGGRAEAQRGDDAVMKEVPADGGDDDRKLRMII